VLLGPRQHHRKDVATRPRNTKTRSKWRITLRQPAINAVSNHPRATPIPIAPAALHCLNSTSRDFVHWRFSDASKPDSITARSSARLRNLHMEQTLDTIDIMDRFPI
jgi:hypothetical protein